MAVLVHLDHLPATALRDLAELNNLVLDGLVICRHAHVERGALCCLGHVGIPS